MALIQVGTGTQREIVDIINPVMEPAWLGVEVVELANDGICFSLCTAWLCKAVAEGSTMDELRVFNEPGEVRSHMDLYLNIVRNHCVYRAIIAFGRRFNEIVEKKLPKPSQGWMAWMMEKEPKLHLEYLPEDITKAPCRTMEEVSRYFVDYASGKRLRVTGFFREKEGERNLPTGSLKENGGFLLGYSADSKDGTSGGHKMAGYVMTDGKLLFYDPNFGIYTADSLGDILEFVTCRYLRDAKNIVYDFCEITSM